MHTLAELEEVIGFFSYSRDDDEDSRGALSDLRDAIQRELGGLLGRSRRTLRLWQDKEAIVPGKLWEAEIKAATSQAVFFIPIVTPRTLNSGYCAFEFQAFLDRERELGRADLMFPILYIRVPELETEALWRDRPVLSVIGARQYVNWQKLRQRDIRDREVREAIAGFCATIADALRAPITPAITSRAEAEAERRRTVDLARAAEQEAEADRAKAAQQQASRLAADTAAGAKNPEGEPDRQPYQESRKFQDRSKTSDDAPGKKATRGKTESVATKRDLPQSFLGLIIGVAISLLGITGVCKFYIDYMDGKDSNLIVFLFVEVLAIGTTILGGGMAVASGMELFKKRSAQ